MTIRRPRPEDPVGFFDSGEGGRCVLNAFRKLLPLEKTEYVADSENCPYGNKPPEEIIRLSKACVERLLALNCKMVVVACNTATAAAIETLRSTWPDVPFIGMEPAVKPAVLKSRSKVVGVLATRGTFNGRLYRETCERFAKGTTILTCVADEFVTFVENGETSGPRVDAAVKARLEPLLKAGADYIVLGCTHFPHLIDAMRRVADGRAEIIEPSRAVAEQAARVLRKLGLLVTDH